MPYLLKYKRWIFPCSVFLLGCFGVFVLPFFFPTPYLKGISVANVAGFNNKVASIAAAVLSVVVFVRALRWPLTPPDKQEGDYGRISPSLVWISAASCAVVLCLIIDVVVRSHLFYQSDAGYFITQISKHTQYGRVLYEQIEFPYGPLLFYAPVALASVLSPFHFSLSTVYYITLVIEHVVGILLAAYILNRLPMLRKWKTLLYLLCAFATLQMNLAANYSFMRFLLPPACLLFAIRRKQPWLVAICFVVGQVISLSVSSEMALAFGAASFAYAAYCWYTQGLAWASAVAAPFVATAGFILLINRSYLMLLKLFALGVLNFVVEPLPHTLIFLFAVLWLVPCGVALYFRRGNPEAPALGTLYVFSLALVPVAFGRADPGHVFLDGLIFFFLSMVTVSTYRRSQQNIWALILSIFFLGTTLLNFSLYKFEYMPALSAVVFGSPTASISTGMRMLIHTGSLKRVRQIVPHSPEDTSFDVHQLEGMVGNGPVATPLRLPLYVQEEIQRAGLFAPTYYCGLFGIYDVTAEERAIQEFNLSQWAVLPEKSTYKLSETPDHTGFAMGIQLTYPAKRPPYVIGNLFNENLASHWELAGNVGIYKVYRRRV